MNAAKKAEECRHVDHFVAAWSGREAIARIDRVDRESLDFVGALANGRLLGLEVVTLTDGDVARSGDLIERFKDELRLAGLASSTSRPSSERHANLGGAQHRAGRRCQQLQRHARWPAWYFRARSGPIGSVALPPVRRGPLVPTA